MNIILSNFILAFLIVFTSCDKAVVPVNDQLPAQNDSSIILPDETGYDSPDNWQFGSDNYWVCAQLKNGRAKTRYADGSPVATFYSL